MSFKDFLDSFNLSELNKLKNMDWDKITQKAKRLSKHTHNCFVCKKKWPGYACDIIENSRKKCSKVFSTNNFCSLKCLKEYFIKKTALKEKEIPMKTLKERAIAFLSLDYFQPKEFNKEGKINIKKEIEKRIKEYPSLQKCDCCQKGKKRIAVYLCEHDRDDYTEGTFCSKKCVQEFIEKKVT